MIKSLEEDKFHNCKVILNLSKIKKENRNNYLNLLRISMMYKIETYAIEYVTFYDKGEKNLHDELIAFQLGQLTIDCEKYNPENNKHKIVKQGGDYTFLTTKDFENIPFVDQIDILKLNKGQEIIIEVEIVKSNGDDHVKFQPVSCPRYELNNKDEGIFQFKNLGMYSSLYLVETAMKDIEKAKINENKDRYFKIQVNE